MMGLSGTGMSIHHQNSNLKEESDDYPVDLGYPILRRAHIAEKHQLVDDQFEGILSKTLQIVTGAVEATVNSH